MRITDRDIFDFSVEAELFAGRRAKHVRSAVQYNRFPHAADAVLFAVEELSPELLLGAFLEIDGERYGSDEIRRLYSRRDFPLSRRTATQVQ